VARNWTVWFAVTMLYTCTVVHHPQVGTKTHMGYSQEAYDTECAAVARALESASRRSMIPERVTIFTDAQAAIRQMASEEPRRGQQYALQERK